jgi:hypothetical protein
VPQSTVLYVVYAYKHLNAALVIQENPVLVACISVFLVRWCCCSCHKIMLVFVCLCTFRFLDDDSSAPKCRSYFICYVRFLIILYAFVGY